MDIVDLTPEHETLYHMCLEDWSDEIREAGDHKKVWCNKMKEKGLRVKLALDDDGQAGSWQLSEAGNGQSPVAGR